MPPEKSSNDTTSPVSYTIPYAYLKVLSVNNVEMITLYITESPVSIRGSEAGALMG